MTLRPAAALEDQGKAQTRDKEAAWAWDRSNDGRQHKQDHSEREHGPLNNRKIEETAQGGSEGHAC